MRQLFIALCIFMLAGCASMFKPADVPVAQDLSPIAQEAQRAINEANITIIAVANTISANVKDKVWTKEQAQGYLDRVKEARRRVRQAQELVDLGKFTEAKSQAEAIQALLVVLHREIAAKARKESQ